MIIDWKFSILEDALNNTNYIGYFVETLFSIIDKENNFNRTKYSEYVYIIYDSQNLFYIGSTNNIKGRINSHFTMNRLSPIACFILCNFPRSLTYNILIVELSKDRLEFEKYLIDKYNPIFNLLQYKNKDIIIPKGYSHPYSLFSLFEPLLGVVESNEPIHISHKMKRTNIINNLGIRKAYRCDVCKGIYFKSYDGRKLMNKLLLLNCGGEVTKQANEHFIKKENTKNVLTKKKYNKYAPLYLIVCHDIVENKLYLYSVQASSECEALNIAEENLKQITTECDYQVFSLTKENLENNLITVFNLIYEK